MATQRSGKFEIVGGPGKFDMMVALFVPGQRVRFKLGGTEEALHHIRLLTCTHDKDSNLELVGVSFLGSDRVLCGFTVLFPSGTNERTMVTGEYDFVTRNGFIDLAPICEIGRLPWNYNICRCGHLGAIRRADGSMTCAECVREHGLTQ